MTATGTAQHIAGVGTVYLAVSDQDRALAFYRDKLGFEVRTDTEFGEGFRWIEVAPAGAYTVIASCRRCARRTPSLVAKPRLASTRPTSRQR
jgi:glyoxalase/bleomycin resistance protein/dioxygenase superfamily protein